MKKTMIFLVAVFGLTGCVGNRINYTSVRIETMGDNAGVTHTSSPQLLNADKQYSDSFNPQTDLDEKESSAKGAE